MITHVRDLIDTWLESYNRERPHDSLGWVPPLTFLPRPFSPGQSNQGSLRLQKTMVTGTDKVGQLPSADEGTEYNEESKRTKKPKGPTTYVKP